jgi:urea carboxylase
LAPGGAPGDALGVGQQGIVADVSGSVWKLLVSKGERVTEGQVVAIVESMKMEVSIAVSEDGVIETIDCSPGTAVVAGQRLMVVRADVAADASEEAACK